MLSSLLGLVHKAHQLPLSPCNWHGSSSTSWDSCRQPQMALRERRNSSSWRDLGETALHLATDCVARAKARPCSSRSNSPKSFKLTKKKDTVGCTCAQQCIYQYHFDIPVYHVYIMHINDTNTMIMSVSARLSCTLQCFPSLQLWS